MAHETLCFSLRVGYGASFAAIYMFTEFAKDTVFMSLPWEYNTSSSRVFFVSQTRMPATQADMRVHTVPVSIAPIARLAMVPFLCGAIAPRTPT
jgi:hypothetical protein